MIIFLKHCIYLYATCDVSGSGTHVTSPALCGGGPDRQYDICKKQVLILHNNVGQGLQKHCILADL